MYNFFLKKPIDSNYLYNPASNMILDDQNVDDINESPSEIGISLWQLGGHPDLMPAFFHFLSNEAVYILTFDLHQDLHELAPKAIFDTKINEWINTTDDCTMTNLDLILNWINMIYHQSRYVRLLIVN